MGPVLDASSQYTENVLIPQFSMESDTYTTSPLISESVLKQEYLENGLSTRDIAKEFACSKTHIRDLLVKYKIPLKNPYQSPKHNGRAYGKKKVNGRVVIHKAEQRTIETIKNMYKEEGLHPKAIARLLDTMKVPTKHQGKSWHHHTITTILKREGIYKLKTTRGGKTISVEPIVRAQTTGTN